MSPHDSPPPKTLVSFHARAQDEKIAAHRVQPQLPRYITTIKLLYLVRWPPRSTLLSAVVWRLQSIAGSPPAHVGQPARARAPNGPAFERTSWYM